MNCPKCGTRMTLVRIIAILGKETSEVREFACPKGRTEKRVRYQDGKLDTG